MTFPNSSVEVSISSLSISGSAQWIRWTSSNPAETCASTGSFAHICKCSIFRRDVVIGMVLAGLYFIVIAEVALCLNIMRVAPYYMRRYELREGVIVSLLTCYSEHVGAHGKMSGRKSLCTGSGLKSGVW